MPEKRHHIQIEAVNNGLVEIDRKRRTKQQQGQVFLHGHSQAERR